MAESRSARYWIAFETYRSMFGIPTARGAKPEVVQAAYLAARTEAAKLVGDLPAKKGETDAIITAARSIQEILRIETRRMETGYEAAFIDLVQRMCGQL